MRAWWVVALVPWLVGAVPGEDAELEAGLDPGTRRELRRARLWSEFELLKDVRHDLFDVYMVSEGRHVSVSLPFMVSLSEEDIPGVVPPAGGRLGRVLRGLGRGALEDQTEDVPALHLAVGGEEDPFLVDVGAMESTVGSGSLVGNYVNSAREGFALDTPGVLLMGRLRGVGATVMTGNVLRPGRVTAVNVSGRPLAWLFGSVDNVKPEGSGGVEGEGLLLNLVDVGVTAAVDMEAPATSRQAGAPVHPLGRVSGVSVEGSVGFSETLLGAGVFVNATLLYRVFEPDGGGMKELYGVGGRAGVRAFLDVKVLRLLGRLEYDVAGQDYIPTYFNRHYEADRVSDLQVVPKVTRRTPPRHGYGFMLTGEVLRTVGVFVQASDLAPLLPRDGGRAMELRTGVLLHLLGFASVMGAYVNRGFDRAGEVLEPSRSSTWMMEERLSLFCFALVARQWRTYEPMLDGRTLSRDGRSVVGQIEFGL
jgi:hypothetical protein